MIGLDPQRTADALDRARALEEAATDLRLEAYAKEQQAKGLRIRWQGHDSGGEDQFPGPVR